MLAAGKFHQRLGGANATLQLLPFPPATSSWRRRQAPGWRQPCSSSPAQQSSTTTVVATSCDEAVQQQQQQQQHPELLQPQRQQQQQQHTSSAHQQPPRVLDRTTGPELLQQLDTLLFDQDGVLWRGNDLIPHAVEALHAFRAAGKRLLFVTNNSSKSRQEYVGKFKGLGIDVAADEIVSSSYTAAAYLDSIGFKQQRLAAGQAPCVLLLGSSGMRDELEAVGLQVVDGEEVQLPLMDNLQHMLDMQLDPRIGAVVLGWDARFTYSKLVYATALIREQGCLFIATNLDHADAISSSGGGDGNGTSAVGRVMPGTGSLVAAVQVASGVQPVNVGKGGAWLFSHLMQQYQLEPSRTAMIGDRLDTDIAMGKEGGLVTLLPLTGVTTLPEALAAPAGAAPDYILDSVASLAGL